MISGEPVNIAYRNGAALLERTYISRKVSRREIIRVMFLRRRVYDR